MQLFSHLQHDLQPFAPSIFKGLQTEAPLRARRTPSPPLHSTRTAADPEPRPVATRLPVCACRCLPQRRGASIWSPSSTLPAWCRSIHTPSSHPVHPLTHPQVDGSFHYAFPVEEAMLAVAKHTDLIYVFFDPIGQVCSMHMHTHSPAHTPA